MTLNEKSEAQVEMTLNAYQDESGKTRLASASWIYVLHNLVGEVGELLSLDAKGRRDGFPSNHRDLVKKELGDILWHVAQLAKDEGFTLEEVAQVNLDKLRSRYERGVIGGSGDNR